MHRNITQETETIKTQGAGTRKEIPTEREATNESDGNKPQRGAHTSDHRLGAKGYGEVGAQATAGSTTRQRESTGAELVQLDSVFPTDITNAEKTEEERCEDGQLSTMTIPQRGHRSFGRRPLRLRTRHGNSPLSCKILMRPKA